MDVVRRHRRAWLRHVGAHRSHRSGLRLRRAAVARVERHVHRPRQRAVPAPGSARSVADRLLPGITIYARLPAVRTDLGWWRPAGDDGRHRRRRSLQDVCRPTSECDAGAGRFEFCSRRMAAHRTSLRCHVAGTRPVVDRPRSSGRGQRGSQLRGGSGLCGLTIRGQGGAGWRAGLSRRHAAGPPGGLRTGRAPRSRDLGCARRCVRRDGRYGVPAGRAVVDRKSVAPQSVSAGRVHHLERHGQPARPHPPVSLNGRRAGSGPSLAVRGLRGQHALHAGRVRPALDERRRGDAPGTRLVRPVCDCQAGRRSHPQAPGRRGDSGAGAVLPRAIARSDDRQFNN